MAEVERGVRRARVDAQRNRMHILDVAEQHFREHGVNGSLDALAKRAGIGPGTLYRHFPTRDALLAALLAARDQGLAARHEAIRSTATDSGAALEQWLEAVIAWATAFDGLPEPLRQALSETTSPLAMKCQGFITDTEDFLGAAQRDGRARPEVRGRDLFLAALAVGWARAAALADSSSPEGLSGLVKTGWSTASVIKLQ